MKAVIDFENGESKPKTFEEGCQKFGFKMTLDISFNHLIGLV
jgi:hypothetical protein